ncbi:T9SS type A sorting domain-containing protein [Dyadobacter sp. CY327]|uniref:T9SS type A sorting domain-containing protein n=1 Tax=Dyadobacter sp. CY327 TaxID=2907301 RepID=UPI001F4303E8|nr:T9SS type A sorting domain-containing protein [Dyadobacter sp. CY327]MCE7071035.1 T9SS type A sorting domain-containing protein [Dyadobacter sp. CY327]
MTSSLLTPIYGTLLILLSAIGSCGATFPSHSISTQFGADEPIRVKKPWIIIKAGGAELPIQLEITGKNQIAAFHLGEFYGIADSQKSIFFNLDKGVVVSTLAVFGTRAIKTPRTATAVNSALHFKNGSTYQFRAAQSTGSRSWDNLNENNFEGTIEISPGLHHVDGYVSYDGSGPFTFPLGNGSNHYYPLTCNGNDGQVITASWISGDPSNGIDPTDANSAHNRNLLQKGIKRVYASGQWDWHVRQSGTPLVGTASPANVAPAAPIKITVKIPDDISSVTGTSITELALVGWNGTQWEPLQDSQMESGMISAFASKPFSAISFGSVDVDPLPVKLVHFSAHPEGKIAVLNWTTSLESNSGYFDIERSVSGRDWLKIGRVSAAGESSQISYYTFSDFNAAVGNNLYRLKMVDQDYSFSYSRIESILIEQPSMLTVYPNPANDILTIVPGNNRDKIVNVIMFDISGRTVHSSQLNSIDVKKFQPGIYTLQITGPKNDIISKNVIIER